MSTAIEINGESITVKELTVAEIRTWLKDLAVASNPTPSTEPKPAKSADILNALLFDDITFTDLLRITTITEQGIDACTPAQLRALVNKCKEVNSDFFVLRERLVALGRTVTHQS